MLDQLFYPISDVDIEKINNFVLGCLLEAIFFPTSPNFGDLFDDVCRISVKFWWDTVGCWYDVDRLPKVSFEIIAISFDRSQVRQNEEQKKFSNRKWKKLSTDHRYNG